MLVAAPAVTGAREAAVASLGIVILAIAARLAKPIQRFRHARLAGATAESALLLAGLGTPVRPPAPVVDPVLAVTVVPTKASRERAEEDPARELGAADAALAAALGTEHPVSAPGRHRTMSGWAAGLQRPEVVSGEPDAETLLAPLPVEPSPELMAELFPDRTATPEPDATEHIEVPDDTPRTGAAEQENPEVMADSTLASETERDMEFTMSSEDLSAAAAAESGSRAQARYSIDWGEDLDWNEVDGVTHPDGWNEGWVAAHGEWWASPQAPQTARAVPSALVPGVAPRPVSRTPATAALPAPMGEPETAPKTEPKIPESAVPASARLEESATLAAWWGAIAEADIGFETAEDVIAAAAASEFASQQLETDAPMDVEIDTEPAAAVQFVLEPPEEVDGWTVDIVPLVPLDCTVTVTDTDTVVTHAETVAELVAGLVAESTAGLVAELVSEVRLPVQRHSGQPSVAERDGLQRAQARLACAVNRITVAEIVTEEAVRLVQADHAALVVRSLEGPRVLWLYPSGELWGPQTLSALLSIGAPVREVVDGDPLAGGAATALLSVPMASAGALAGAVIVRRNTPKPFTAPEENLLDRLARMAGAALDALTRRGVLRSDEDNVDPVTGLAPQDRLLHDLRVALRTREDHGMPVTLLVAEIEGISRMRTELGAGEADEALQLISTTVASGLRVGDVPYRLGEDELAVLLAATDTEDAEAVAARLADEADTASAESFQRLARPLRMRTAVVAVVGTAEDVVAAANRALAAQRVQARWERRMPNTQF